MQLAPPPACDPQTRPTDLPAAGSAGKHLALDFTGGDENNMDCSWRVECGASGKGGGGRATALLLQFTAFDTESNFDFVSLADGSGSPIAGGDGLSGSAVAGQTFGDLNGTLAVHFTSDGAAPPAACTA